MEQKHPCPDCRQCQWCSDDRCRRCLQTGCRQQLSQQEELELYERLNPDLTHACGAPFYPHRNQTEKS